jgi:hypothetical protein
MRKLHRLRLMKVSGGIVYINVCNLLCEGLRIEWAKSWARMYRWDEEVELVVEEMRCVLCLMEWCAHYWKSLVSKQEVADAMVREGIAAYAEKQAYIAQAMGKHFAKEWLPIHERYCFTPNWPTQYNSDISGISEDVVMG